VILGCTEIELLIGAADSPLPVFPTTRLHVEAERYSGRRRARACLQRKQRSLGSPRRRPPGSPGNGSG
jgi:hypothetical protein